MNNLVRMSGAHVVVECIKSNDVEYVFGIGGQSIIPILDVLSESQEIRYISVRHEQIATYMADGYARYSGKPGVVFVSRAGGASNTVTGVVTAYSSDSPVVIIAGMPPIQNQNRGDYQDFDLASVFRPITKFSYQVEGISKLQNILYRAFRTALSGRPGPVFIGIPTSILHEDLDMEISAYGAPPDKSERKPPPKLIEEITDMLLESKSPAIMAGNGITLSDAHGELIELSETFAIPVMPDYGTLDIVPTNHPLLIRDMGALTEIDLLLVVGTNIAALSRWPKTRKTPRIIQIEIDESQIGKVHPATIGVVADLKPAMKAIKENLEKKIHEETKNQVKKRSEDIRVITKRLDSERWPKKEWNAILDRFEKQFGFSLRAALILFDGYVDTTIVSTLTFYRHKVRK